MVKSIHCNISGNLHGGLATEQEYLEVEANQKREMLQLWISDSQEPIY